MSIGPLRVYDIDVGSPTRDLVATDLRTPRVDFLHQVKCALLSPPGLERYAKPFASTDDFRFRDCSKV